MYYNLYKLELTRKVKAWIFPKDRFVEWGPEDESYCRMAGYGREGEKEEKITIPSGYIMGMSADGRITFKSVQKIELCD